MFSAPWMAVWVVLRRRASARCIERDESSPLPPAYTIARGWMRVLCYLFSRTLMLIALLYLYWTQQPSSHSWPLMGSILVHVPGKSRWAARATTKDVDAPDFAQHLCQYFLSWRIIETWREEIESSPAKGNWRERLPSGIGLVTRGSKTKRSRVGMLTKWISRWEKVSVKSLWRLIKMRLSLEVRILIEYGHSNILSNVVNIFKKNSTIKRVLRNLMI